MPGAGSSEDVEAFLRVNVVPERRAERRLAPALGSVEKHAVRGPQGEIAAWRVGAGPALEPAPGAGQAIVADAAPARLPRRTAATLTSFVASVE